MKWTAGSGTFPSCAAAGRHSAPESFFNDFEVTHEFEHIGRRAMLLNARRLDSEAGAGAILLSIEDITERLQAQAALRLRKFVTAVLKPPETAC
jgi:hypothetical protein